MNFLYIGSTFKGSTSWMRAEFLRSHFKSYNFVSLSLESVQDGLSRVSKSIGWRFNAGPLIWNLNNKIESFIEKYSNFEIVWIDKGGFIYPKTLQKLKKSSKVLIHFTPDTAFHQNKSVYFNKGIPIYDFCISSKTFEYEKYRTLKVKALIPCTQAYDKNFHKPYHEFNEKAGVVFIGKNEPSREKLIKLIIENDIPIKLCGPGWERFYKKHRERPLFQYFGSGIFGIDYSKLISSSKIGLGLLSKTFPELHTTRTFEIPACKTALLTEKNIETQQFYNETEVIFESKNELIIEKLRFYLSNDDALESITEKGYQKVTHGNYDYQSMLNDILIKIGI